MSTEIYYFSGSGNSLAIARDITGRIGGRLVSIPSTESLERVDIRADVIGIVFPVYHATFGESGIPGIVRRFLDKLGNIGSKYIFAVCSHSGMPAFTMKNLSGILADKGGELSAGFTVKMSVPYPLSEKMKHALFRKELNVDMEKDREDRQELFEQWGEKLKVIEDVVINHKRTKLEAPGRAIQILAKPFFALNKKAAMTRYRKLSGLGHGSFQELTMLADRSFTVDGKCNGCGICNKVCPVHNIEIVEGKPTWQNLCENCYACYQWCPEGAIYGTIIEYEKRYHHPDVRLSDVIRERRS